MSDLRTFFATYFGPGCLAGITGGDWVRLLAENGFRVSPRYLPRAGMLTASSLVTSPFRWAEAALFQRAVQQATVQPPVFILGSWRSGTTLLHNLLCVDQRFAYPNLFQTMYPHSFLVGESWYRPFLDFLTPRKRFMDNMVMGLREPAEDEMALGINSLKSNMFSWVFPQNAAKYEQQLSFTEASEADRIAWKQGMEWFVKKLAYKYEKPLVMKSPNHTARIQLLLELFPQAKFLHIRRNPLEVFRSMCHMASKVIPVWGLQTYDPQQIPDMVIETYKRLYDAYFDQVGLIPKGQFYEVGYDQLAQQPLAEIEKVYEELSLPAFGVVRPQLETYIKSLSDYKRNQHSDIPIEIKQRLADRWSRCFETWGYDPELTSAPTISQPPS